MTIMPTTTPLTKALDFRRRVLDILLWVAWLGAIGVGGVNVFYALRAAQYGRAAGYVAAIVFVGLLILAGRWEQAYAWRVWGMLAVLYAVAVSAYLGVGVGGDGRVWLMGVVVIGAVLLPPPHNYLNFVGALALHFALGYAISHHMLPPPPNELLVNSLLFSAWTRTGVAVVAIAAIVLVVVSFYRSNLENALEESQQLNVALEEERRRLEARDRELQRRLDYIATASEIARIINTILDPDELLERVVNLVRDRFQLYYVGIFLVDERGEYAVLKAGTGEAGRKMLAEGHRLAIGGASMIGWAISNRKPRIAMDVGEEAVRFVNPHLPLTRTELALPLISHGEVLGAMTVQSERAQAFDQHDLSVLQNIVDNLAVALYNARLYQESRRGLQALAESHRRVLAEVWQEMEVSDLEVAVEQPEQGEEARAGGATAYRLQVPVEVYGVSLGELVLESSTPWSEEDTAFAKQAARQLAVSLENIYLTYKNRQSAQEDRLLGELTAQIGSSLEMDEIVQTALRQLRQVLGVEEAEIHLVGAATEE